MKTNKMKWLFTALVVALLVIGAAGWGIHALAQTDAAAKQMEMMKKMMMNRPQSMKDADEAIQKHKREAAAQGKYACCLKHPCDDCALKMGECPCAKNVAQDMAVCNECKGGWHAGDGSISGKTADQIKTMPRMGM